MNAEHTEKNRRAGFTLLELLVVIGIIGILAAILLPGLGSAREQSRRSHCLNNFKQIGLALIVYSNNFGEYLPSHAAWGALSYTYTLDAQRLTPWMGHQGVSRHRVLGYGAAESDASQLTFGRLNFAPVGLGILVARSQITARTLVCLSMSGTVNTWYAGAQYQYVSEFPSMLGESADPPLTTGDGRSFSHVNADPGTTVTAAIGSYSYRDTPFYSRLKPANAPVNWAYTSDYPDLADPANNWLAQWPLSLARGAAPAQFMCPPFKTVRSLGNRSIASDGFDFAPAGGGSFTAGIGVNDHRDGYNVLYGDGHGAWFSDERAGFAHWNDWSDPANPGSDNLTISSASSQIIWNQFDQAAGIDRP